MNKLKNISKDYLPKISQSQYHFETTEKMIEIFTMNTEQSSLVFFDLAKREFVSQKQRVNKMSILKFQGGSFTEKKELQSLAKSLEIDLKYIFDYLIN